MHILNIANAIKNMSVNEIRDLNFENFYKRIGFSKENSYYLMKHTHKKLILFVTKITEKISDPFNAIERYRSLIRNKNCHT